MQLLGASPVLVALAVVCGTLFLSLLQRVILQPLLVLRKLWAQGVPGYPFVPVIGNLWDIIRLQIRREKDPDYAAATLGLPFHFEGTEKYGKVFTWCFGQVPSVTITDPAMIRQVYVNKMNHFVKSVVTKKLTILGKGIATAEGEAWVRQRRLLSPSFHMVELRRLFPNMAKLALEAVRAWERSAEGNPGKPIMMDVELTNVTLEIITGMAFGANLDAGLRSGIQDAFQEYLHVAPVNQMLSTVFPPYAYLPVSSNTAMWRAERFVKEAMRKIVKERLEQAKSDSDDWAQRGLVQEQRAGSGSSDNKVDLLQLMMNVTEGIGKAPEGSTSRISDSTSMTEQQLIDECVTFLFGGHETTSILLTWTMLLLSQHKEWQEKAREEVLGLSNGPDWVPDFDSLSQMKVVTSVLNESLRLFPPGAAIVRNCTRDTKLSENLTVPAGCDVWAAVEVLHLSEELWGPDVKDFNPLRFAEGASKASSQAGAFIPFSLGPRVCLGQNFAMIEAKIILSLILKNFSWEVADTYQHHPFVTITTRPKYGLPVIMTPLRSERKAGA